MVVRRLRPHHGMCIQFFHGAGYSSEFVDKMSAIIGYLNENDPELRLLPGCDQICACCPNDQGGLCRKAELVRGYDLKVLERCGLTSGCSIRWSDFSQLVRELIINTGKRPEICGDCSWNSLCLSQTDAQS